jgi:hypothetical protein
MFHLLFLDRRQGVHARMGIPSRSLPCNSLVQVASGTFSLAAGGDRSIIYPCARSVTGGRIAANQRLAWQRDLKCSASLWLLVSC